jgi:hypothetical protein
MTEPTPFSALLSSGVEQWNSLGVAGIVGGFILVAIVIMLWELGRDAVK